LGSRDDAAGIGIGKHHDNAWTGHSHDAVPASKQQNWWMGDVGASH
jgi:hypothetical protein